MSCSIAIMNISDETECPRKMPLRIFNSPRFDLPLSITPTRFLWHLGWSLWFHQIFCSFCYTPLSTFLRTYHRISCYQFMPWLHFSACFGWSIYRESFLPLVHLQHPFFLPEIIPGIQASHRFFSLIYTVKIFHIIGNRLSICSCWGRSF